MTTVNGSYSHSYSCCCGASIWGVVGVLFPWGGRLVLPFLVLLLLLFLYVYVCAYVCVCDLCNCHSYCCFYLYFCFVVKILKRKKKILKKVIAYITKLKSILFFDDFSYFKFMHLDAKEGAR